MKATSLALAVTCAVASLTANLASGFSISAVSISPSNVVPAMTELRMTIDIVTPSQGTWLYAPTQISSNAGGLRVDVFPTSGLLTAIGSLRETVTLGVFPAGTHDYEVVIHPNFQVNWGTRTNRGSFTVTDDSHQPVVYISASVPDTLEPSPNTRVRPGEFTITRVGDTNESLLLFVEFTGTATFGHDYQEVSQYLIMPASERKLTFLVGPLDDSLVEGDETVIATLARDPPIDSLPNYSVHPRLNQATIVIHDNDFPDDRPVVSITGPSRVLEFCPPNADCIGINFFLRRTGAGLERPLTVSLLYGGTAIAEVDYGALPRQATFEAGQDFASVFSVPIDDALYEGDETIIAHIIESSDYYVDPNRTSATTVIHDNDPPAPPVVSLELVGQEAMETRIDQNAIFWAEFRALRTGPVTEELVVFLNTRQGSARLGEDYWLDGVTDGSAVRFPAGASSVNVRLYPIDDDFYEGDESAFFHLLAPPLGADPYEIDHAHSSVSMVIHDNDPVTTRLEIIAPRNGEHFEAGDTIRLQARIIGPGSSNSWIVEFFDGGQSIGTTQLGGAIFWQNAIGGEHVINARAYDPTGIPGNDALVARPVTIFVGPGPALPVVSINARWKTAEPCPVCLVAPGIFTVSRTGPTNQALNVYLEFDGTAAPGRDYQELPRQVTIPPGTNAVEVLVLPFDDLLVEGPEIVRASIALPEFATRGYIASFFAREAMVVIGDDEAGAPEIRLDIVEPEEGAQFAEGAIIEVSALGVWTQGEVDRPVEFFADNLLIGRSNPPQFLRPTIPCLPSVHTIFWTNPPPGRHALRARFEPEVVPPALSPVVNITVGSEPAHTVVSIGTDDAEASELPPFVDGFDPAQFRISRSGDLTQDLLVFFSVAGGSATPGQDYQTLQSPVHIPAGEQAVTLQVVPLPDELAEGMETVFVRLEPSPLVGPLPTYEINPRSRDAVAVILDDEVAPVPGLEIVSPGQGESFFEPQGIDIVAAAYHPTQDILGVDFYADGGKIGNSSLIFDKAVTGGLIVHRFHWPNPSPGQHVLTARGFTENGELAAVSPPISIIVHSDGARTVVKIEATQWIAEEDSTPFDRIPFAGVFTISRSGPTSDSLSVYVQYSGSATAGEDYPVPLGVVTIPAGAASTEIRIVPIPDHVPEGIETVLAAISDCPPVCPECALVPCYDFGIDPAHASATVFIREDGVTRTSLVITNPKEGAEFSIGETILIEATAIDLDGYINQVELWDGDQRITTLVIDFIRAPDPGTPIHFSFPWSNASLGSHLLTARAVSTLGERLQSPSVHITVKSEPPGPVVHIEATQRIAEETSFPLRRLPLRGEFTISRTGPTNEPLSVFVHYSGTATPGADYPRVPWLVEIPAGVSSTRIEIVPEVDEIPEGIETLTAMLSHCPPLTDPPLGAPCFGGFKIDPAQERATVFIRDDGITQASLTITNPRDGANFRLGETILIEAVAIHLEGYISRVEFWAGEQQIGVSEIVFIRAPDPGTPIHHGFEWREAASGPHVLTARAGVEGAVLRSRPVHITVGPAGNQLPTVAITAPADGTIFPPDTNIEIIAEVRDPDGYVPKVEFFADGRKIGERIIVFIRPPDPGQPQRFSFVWQHPTPGRHALTARATDDDGESTVSAPVEILVTPPDMLPIVTVVARDPFAVEPTSASALNTAMFRIRRFGPTNDWLPVTFSLQGTALGGVDYESFSGGVVIPPGKRSVTVTVRPLPDNVAEGIETVILRLEDPPPVGPLPEVRPPGYRVGFPRRAVALISDRPFVQPPRGVRCVPLAGGWLYVCFAAETGQHFRVEATSDFGIWETVFDSVAADGMLHFVEEDAANFPHRFYRLAPESVTEADD